MQDNPVIHALYTVIAIAVDNISTIAAVILFTLQLIVIAPKAYKTIKGLFSKKEK